MLYQYCRHCSPPQKKNLWHTSTLLSIIFGIFIYKYLFYRHFEIIKVTCFLTVFINKNYFLWELNAQNLMIIIIMKMIPCYNLLWYIKGPRLLWIYFHPYQHGCTQNTLKLQEISVFNFLETVWLMVSHQILNLTRHALFQNMLPYKVLLCQHPERPINIHNLHL
jgi:hypothetical protein